MDSIKDGYVDLHVHSIYSDGSETIEELIREAGKAGISVLAITDHNTLSLEQPVKKNSVFVIPGCEFSAEAVIPKTRQRAEVHIIGLFPFGVSRGSFSELFSCVTEEQRLLYIKAVIAGLNRRGFAITVREVRGMNMKTSAKAPLYRQDIARVLVEKGYFRNTDEALDCEIGNHSPHYINPCNYYHYPRIEEVVRKIRDADGVPVLCHPMSYPGLDREMIEQLAADFKRLAGDVAAIEVCYRPYGKTSEKTRFLEMLRKKYNLLPSAAGDRHRPDQPFCTIRGTDLYDDLVNALKDSMEKKTEALPDGTSLERIIAYRCRWCGKIFRTSGRHVCKFDPVLRNCLSCRHCRGVRFIAENGQNLDEFEAENGEYFYEKWLQCDLGCDPFGEIRSLPKLSARGWRADCGRHESMDNYAGKASYYEKIMRLSMESSYQHMEEVQ